MKTIILCICFVLVPALVASAIEATVPNTPSGPACNVMQDELNAMSGEGYEMTVDEFCEF